MAREGDVRIRNERDSKVIACFQNVFDFFLEREEGEFDFDGCDGVDLPRAGGISLTVRTGGEGRGLQRGLFEERKRRSRKD